MVWIIYGVAVLLLSGLIGLHLGRFREAYTEMTGMMAGMTMGMLNGFMFGYAAAGLFSSMFWGNMLGIVLGTAVGCYYGRAGGLMGMMDGGMGGMMGGSMGAMLMVMLVWPQYIAWTAILLAIVYLLGMAGLVALIERSAPEHAALHLLLPMFTRAIAAEAAEQTRSRPESTRRAPIDDYYTFLGVGQDATGEQITSAYLEQLSIADEETVARAERAYSTLTDPTRRRPYDARLSASIAAGDCCPPPRRERAAQAATRPSAAAATATAKVQPDVTRRPTARVAGKDEGRRTKDERRDTFAPRPPSPGAKNGEPRQSARAAAPPPRPTSRQPVARSQDAPRKSAVDRRRALPSQAQDSSGQAVVSRRTSESPISWVGIAAGLFIAMVLLIWWLFAQGHAGATVPLSNPANGNSTTNSSALPQDVAQRLEAEAVVVPVGADGRQTLDFAVNGSTRGYKPSVLKVKEGVPVHLNVTVEGSDPGCGRYIGVQGLGVHTIASPGEAVAWDFTPTRIGIFQINCDMHMMDPGYVIVTQ